MTQSMTGFARASVTTGAVTVTVECRSVNNRYLDLHFRMPDNLRSIESALRNKANEYCSRGKLEFVIRTTNTDCDAPTAINAARLFALQGALGHIENAFPTAAKPDQLALLLAPGVLAEQETDPETLGATALAAASDCLAGLRENRQQEGEKLAEMIRQRVGVMRGHLQNLHNHFQGELHDQLQDLQDHLHDHHQDFQGEIHEHLQDFQGETHDQLHDLQDLQDLHKPNGNQHKPKDNL